jgi:uridine kinase
MNRGTFEKDTTGWSRCVDAIREAAGKGTERILVTIDGPCATGKTTLAGKLAEEFGAAVVHTDDFVIPHKEKTPERLAVPGGNCDAERLVREVAAPWKRGKPVLYREYDCRNDRMRPEKKLPDCRILILEGSYGNLPEIREYADVRIFLKAPMEIRESRLERRESAQSLQMFHERWIPLEDRYFEAYSLPDRGCVVIDAGGAAEIRPRRTRDTDIPP